MGDSKDLYFVDTDEMIKKCLNCKKKTCDNCLGDHLHVIKAADKIDHNEFVRLYELLYTDQQIAEALGVTLSVVRGYRKRHGLRSKRARDGIDKARLIELYEQGFNDYEIADVLGMTPSYICTTRKRMGLASKHSPGWRKEKHAKRVR